MLCKQLQDPRLTPYRIGKLCAHADGILADLQNWVKPKKKVGRPITYNGDPNAPELTEAERRKVKRRIANRESARRVQQRRKEMIDELQHKVHHVIKTLPAGSCNSCHGYLQHLVVNVADIRM